MKQLTFEQLPPHLREQAINDYRDGDYVDLSFTVDGWKRKLSDLGYVNPSIKYSGFWNQGDGASFSCDYIPNPMVSEAVRSAWDSYVGACNLLGEQPEGDITSLAWGRISVRGPHYVHENMMELQWELDAFPNYPWHNEPCRPFLEALQSAVSEYVEGALATARGLARQIYRDLQENYEWQMSDECISGLLSGDTFDVDDDETELI